tara:strand:- start:706 stop:1041 length:336 start_codon:yes stop_codon:yes gene_type:complete
MEAVAWRWEEQFMGVWRERLTHERPEDGPRVRGVQALAVIPTEGLGSSLRDTHRVAETAVVVPKEPTEAMIEAGLEWSGDCNGGEREMMGLAYAAMIAAAPASDTTGGENQ